VVDSERKSDDVEHHLHRFSFHLPEWAGRHVRGLASGTRWVRVPVALALIVGGVFGFLPVLGFWMVPLGLLLLAVDLPFLRRPMVALVLWVEARWHRWRGKSAEPTRPDDGPRA
jgi:hypothetical protein